MYYEFINGQWQPNRNKSEYFDGDTYPIAKLPDKFWNAERKLVAPVIVPEPPTADEIAAEFENKKQEYIRGIQYHLDKTAKTRGYDSVDSATKYIGGKKPLWDAEGAALRDWTIDVWDASFIVLADITDGTRQEPTIDELLAELPEMIWPTI